jgi:hypothetical protein
MSDPTPTSGFAPRNPTDGRQMGEWQSRYDEKAQREINFEVWLVAPILFIIPVLILIVWRGWPKYWLGVDDTQYLVFSRYCYAWLGGTLGGTLFDLKWLYHSVAKGFWNIDRRLWRLFTPHMSGGLAFAVIIMIFSGMFGHLVANSMAKSPLIIGISFLVGYFSDRAIGKLAEIADTLFGATAADK